MPGSVAARLASRTARWTFCTYQARSNSAFAEVAARTGRYACLVALGVVVRGETAHFDFVAGEAARSLAEVARVHALPVGFGLLTTETMAQAAERAGGVAGNKGHEAAEAALAMADLIGRLTGPDATA